jgi:uncharacterized protein YoaH (UPF0181 family)
MNDMSKTIVKELMFGGMSPQQAIRYLTDSINRVKEADRRFLKIETYYDDFGNPFEQNPSKELRLVIDKSYAPSTKTGDEE